MSIPATDATALPPAPAPSSAPAAAEPTATEPVATEPAAAEPTAVEPEAPTFSSSVDFGWDDWDGKGDNLPVEVQGWYSKFDEHFGTEREGLAKAHTEALAGINSDAEQYKRMYQAVYDGVEDPRIAEMTDSQATLQGEYDAAKAGWESREGGYKEIIQQGSDQYLNMVKQVYKTQLASLTPEQNETIMGLLDSFELHNALDIVSLGAEAVVEANNLSQGGASEEIILRVLGAEFKPAPQTSTQVAEVKRQARRPANHPSKVVAGAQPQQTPAPSGPPNIAKMSRRDRLSAVAQRAIKAERTRSR